MNAVVFSSILWSAVVGWTMNTQNLWFYRDQLYRIIQEALEASLIICKWELSEFTLAKIFDVFLQIIPTGFVLNTGYWPFFNSRKRQCICVCGRYGIDCRHSKHESHWIDLDNISNDSSTLFSSKLGNLIVMDSLIELTPITAGTLGYKLNIKFTFQYRKIQRGRTRQRKDENFNVADGGQLFQVIICSIFNLQKEYYPAMHTVCFQPSPFTYTTYGTIFPCLLRARGPHVDHKKSASSSLYTVVFDQMPHFTLILQQVNLPTYQYSRHIIIPAPLAQVDQRPMKRSTSSRSTQTDSLTDIQELWRCRDIWSNVMSLWSSPLPSTLSESINSPDFPLQAGAEGLYEWPEIQFKKPTPSKKKNRKTTIRALEASGGDYPDILSFSYASMATPPKPGLILEDNCENFTNMKPKEEDGFERLHGAIPKTMKTGVIKQEQIDEEFDIVEEFIKQERDKEVVRWREPSSSIL
ncbi:uncharacterized protein [Euwallacea fornicatus]|uniref:uncharacterized protein n=1 Tax=Euwallacea fornicatus TaxID=995702 RepID=UPI00338DD69E